MVVDDVVRIVFFFATRQGVDGWPLLAVLAEFRDNLTAKNAYGMLGRSALSSTKTYQWRQ